MSHPAGASLHHGCTFVLRPRYSPVVDWSSLVRTIRSWVARRITEEQTLGRAWFFTGGEWVSRHSRRLGIRTRRAICAGSPDTPEFWAIQFDHPCTEFSFRQWRTDIGLTAIAPDSVAVSLQTYHWILSGYIGEEPKAPVPSAPGIVPMLLGKTELRGFSGSEEIAAEPFRLPVGHGKRLIRSLEDKDRRCPIVLISCAPDTGMPRLDAETLARLLAGSAKIVVADSSSVDEELDYLIPRSFRCSGGTVRVYQPGVMFNSEFDSRRHRFFTHERIDDVGADAVLDMLVRSASRRARFAPEAEVSAIDDVRGRDREFRLHELRSRQADVSEQEWIAALEEDNAALNAKLDELASRIEDLQMKSAELQDEIDDRHSDLSSRDGEIRFLRSQLEQVRNEAATIEGRLGSLSSLCELPTTVHEMLEVIEKLHAGRVFFTEQAYRSAQAASFDEPETAWRCLWSIPQVLWALIFEDESRDLAREYERCSGFELALTETGLTKKDKDLRALRRDVFDGSEVDITPHIKIGNREPKCLRVHFYVDRTKKLIVVGHCGDHLTTAGTRRRK